MTLDDLALMPVYVARAREFVSGAEFQRLMREKGAVRHTLLEAEAFIGNLADEVERLQAKRCSHCGLTRKNCDAADEVTEWGNREE